MNHDTEGTKNMDRFEAKKIGNGWRVVDTTNGHLHSARIADEGRAVRQAVTMNAKMTTPDQRDRKEQDDISSLIAEAKARQALDAHDQTHFTATNHNTGESVIIDNLEASTADSMGIALATVCRCGWTTKETTRGRGFAAWKKHHATETN